MDDDFRAGFRNHAPERRPVPDVDLVQVRLLIDPLATTTRQRVDEGCPVAGRDEPLDQVTADEACSAGYEDTLRQPIAQPARSTSVQLLGSGWCCARRLAHGCRPMTPRVRTSQITQAAATAGTTSAATTVQSPYGRFAAGEYA